MRSLTPVDASHKVLSELNTSFYLSQFLIYLKLTQKLQEIRDATQVDAMVCVISNAFWDQNSVKMFYNKRHTGMKCHQSVFSNAYPSQICVKT